MQRKYQHMAKRRIRQSKRQQAWQIVLTSLSLLVVIGTVGALISPAVTMEQETFCTLEAHLHTQECYGPALCQPDSADAHLHTDSCYTQETGLVCTLPEGPGHTHSGECESVQQKLICELEESEAHAHGDDCWEANTVYICGSEESEAHTHGDGCFTTAQTLTCTLEEAETHTHNASCYPETPLCQLEEHQHTLICYSDPNADLETASTWEQTLPELSGNWAADLVAVALSQLGYQESTHNYTVENEETVGYTRYGAWAGTPYAAWSELFVAFCLDYARIPQDALPRCSGSQLWLEALTAAELFAASDRQPIPGDLIFLDTDGQPGADRMGIVTGISDDGSTVEVIEGDYANSVQRRSYDSADPAILGYGLLPEQPAILADGDTYTVWADPSNGNNQFYKGVSVTTYENIPENSTITLPTAQEVGSPSDYPYTLQQWVDIATKTAYAPGATITVTENMVLYADWEAASYNIGAPLPGHDVKSLSTKDFATVEMFDYNDLVNLNAATINTSRATGADKETWTALSPSVSGLLPLNTWRSPDYDKSLDYPELPSIPGEAIGIYRGNSSNGKGYIAQGLSEYALDYYFDTTGSNIGVTPLGTGDYLFQYDEAQGYYYFNSHSNGAAFNRSEGRFYLYDQPSKTTCIDSEPAPSKGDFLPFNTVTENHDSTLIDHDGTGDQPVDANYWYGMHITVDFYVPAVPGTDEGLEMNKSANDNSMVYYFSGDDDVWVFLDGKLVLDMGGIHEPVDGFINFANGKVLTTDAGGNPTDTTLDALIPDFSSGDHTLEMYYMERGGGLANCKIYFNLPARQNLQLNKVDRQHPDASMEGTTFEVFEDLECTVPATDLYSDSSRTDESRTNIFTIDSNNQDTLYGFYCKKPYYIKETNAPEGYELANRVLQVEFDYTGTMTVTTLPDNTLPGYDGNVYSFIDDNKTDDDNLGVVTVFNAKTAKDLTLRKIWYKDDGSVDTGKTDPVTVTIYRTTAKNASPDSTMELYKTVTIKDGTSGVLSLVLEDVEQYDENNNLYYYHIVEQSVDGYTATYIGNGTIAGGTITAANAPGVTVEYEKPTFTLTKKDDAGNLLPGAVFRLYEYSPTANDYVYVADYTVGSEGTIIFHEELKYNTAYYIEELQAPDGYLKNPNRLYFGISHDDSALYPMAAPSGFAWTAADAPGQYGGQVINYGNPSLTLEKVDSANTGITLPGAKFALYKWSGTEWVTLNIGLTTGDNGQLKLDKLEYNTVYKIVETAAPDGYFLENQQLIFQIPAPEGYGFAETVKPDDVTVQNLTGGTVIQVKNEKMPELTIKKVNQDETLTLADAEFTLWAYTSTGWSKIEALTTGEDGTLLLEKLNYDTLYRLEETQAPDGYLIDAEYHYFWIPSSATAELTLPDGMTEDQIHIMESDETEYVLTIHNSKIPTLSVVKEWYDKDGNLIADASGFDSISFTLYQKAEYSAVKSDEATITFNMETWGAYYQHSSIPFPVGTTVTIELSQNNVDSWELQNPVFNINGLAIEYEDEKKLIDEQNGKYNRTCTLVLENVSEDILITGSLNWNISTWTAPVFTYDYPKTGEAPPSTVKQLYIGELSSENNWRYDCLLDLKTSEQVEIDGQTYLATYTYYVIESPIPNGYDVSYDNNDLNLDLTENKVITIINKRNDQDLTELTVTKVDQDDSDTVLPGAKFTLYQWDSTLSDWTEVNTLTTGADGTLTFPNLSYNTAYKLVETEAPAGYNLNNAPRYFFFEHTDMATYPVSRPAEDLTYSAETSVQIENEKKHASLSVQKKWFDLDGREFDPTDIDEIIVELYYRAGETGLDFLYRSYTLRKADGWKLDIYDLPTEGTVEINGVPTPVQYVYYVKELPIPFYTTTYDGQNVAANTGASITVTNTQIPAFELPETGGNAALLYALGTLLTATAALAGKKRRSKR